MALIPAMVHSARENLQSRMTKYSEVPRESDDVKVLFKNMPLGDLWHDAQMQDLLAYLKGNKHLSIPAEWRPYLPSRLE